MRVPSWIIVWSLGAATLAAQQPAPQPVPQSLAQARQLYDAGKYGDAVTATENVAVDTTRPACSTSPRKASTS